MESGKMNSRVTIEQPVLAARSGSRTGERTQTFTPLFSSYANIRSDTGELLAYAKSFAATIDHVVTIPYTTAFTITKKCRVNYGGRYFTIGAVLDKDNSRRFWTLLCVEAT